MREIQNDQISDERYRQKWAEIDEKAPADVAEALKHFAAAYFNGPAIVDWMASLWEPYFCACGKCAAEGRELACDGGAFYYANSARDNDGFFPDVESTGFILSGLAATGAFDAYGGWANAVREVPGMREQLIRFAQSLQDKESGYFYHPQWGSSIGSSRRGRDLPRSIRILEALGARPLYPTAIDRLNAAAAEGRGVAAAAGATPFEKSLVSVEEYKKWLVQITNGDDMLKNSAGAHTIASVSAQILAAGYMDVTLDYLDMMAEKCYAEMKVAYDADPINNPRPTGLWQRTVDYNSVWGLIKLEACYSKGNRPFPYYLEAMDSCIQAILFDPEYGGNYHMNDVMNQWGACEKLITSAKKHHPELVDSLYAMAGERAVKMIKCVEGKLAKFIQPDGSYGYNQGTSAPTTQGVPVSLGLPEGDSNATELAKNTYIYVFRVLGYTPPKMCDPSDGERVLEMLRAKSRR